MTYKGCDHTKIWTLRNGLVKGSPREQWLKAFYACNDCYAVAKFWSEYSADV